MIPSPVQELTTFSSVLPLWAFLAMSPVPSALHLCPSRQTTVTEGWLNPFYLFSLSTQQSDTQ